VKAGSRAGGSTSARRGARAGGSSKSARRSRAAAPAVVEAATAEPDRPIEQRIAERAYAIWQSRGGDERSNWLEAERQIRDGIA
jgi:hypothetical protein